MQTEEIICTDSNPQPNHNGTSINNNDPTANPSPYSSSPLSSEEREKILSQFREDLKTIDESQMTIERISSSCLSLIYRYPDIITNDLLNIIDEEVHIYPSIVFLYLVNDIVQKIFLKTNINNVNNNLDDEYRKNLIDSFFPFIRDICFCLYYTMNEDLQKKVSYILLIWKNMKIFKKENLEAFDYEIKMNTEPDFKGGAEETKLLKTLVDNGFFKIDQNLMEFSKELEALERTKDNKHRKNILQTDKDLINKQLRLYNDNIKKLKDINLLLNKIKEFEESDNKEKDNKIEEEERIE